MEFFTKTLGSLSFSSSAFSQGEKVELLHEYPSIWTVYQGTVKKDKTPCTLFEFDASLLENDKRQVLAENSLRLLRKLRFPGLLKIIDSEQYGSTILIATERVTPISQVLPNLSDNAKLWGLQCLLATLNNLHTHTKLVHGNVNLGSVFENAAGEWVLGGFEIASFLTDTQSMLSYGSFLPGADAQATWVPTEVQKQGWSAVTRQPELVDSYEFGQLISTVLKGTRSPPDVSRLAQVLCGAKRPTIENAFSRSSIFDTPLTSIAEGVSSLMIMNDFDFLKYVQFVDSVASDLPPTFIGGKLLPELAKSTGNGKGGIEAIRVIVHLSTLIREEQFQAYALPYIIHLFGSMDRAVRLELLKALPNYIELVPNSVVQSKIMPAMAPGFADQEALIRQESLRAVIFLAPKLSNRQMNEELLRLLARTNSDKDSNIRAQTVLLLSQISNLLSPSKRSSVVVTALSRALKDPTIVVRKAALQALEETSQYFTAQESAEKLLGPAATSLLDKDWEVRSQAKKVTDSLFTKVNEESAKMDQSSENGAPPGMQFAQETFSLFSAALNVGGPDHQLAGNVASKLASPASATPEPVQQPQFGQQQAAPRPAPVAQVNVAPKEDINALFKKAPATASSGIVQESADFRFDDEQDGGDADGWDNWGEEVSEPVAPVKKPAARAASKVAPKPKASAQPAKTLSLDPEDDEDAEGWDW